MAITVGERVFIDTNILIYRALKNSPWHEVANQRLLELQTAGAEMCISRQILREYMASMTRPEKTQVLVPLSEVLADVKFFEDRYQILEDGELVTNALLVLLTETPCLGRQVYDANIVATMQVHGVPKLLTHNTADFERFSGKIIVEPLMV